MDGQVLDSGGSAFWIVHDCDGMNTRYFELCAQSGTWNNGGSLTARPLEGSYTKYYKGNVTIAGDIYVDDVFIGGRNSHHSLRHGEFTGWTDLERPSKVPF